MYEEASFVLWQGKLDREASLGGGRAVNGDVSSGERDLWTGGTSSTNFPGLRKHVSRCL